MPAPRLPKNSFMCFLQEYRDEVPKGRQNQKQLAEQAGRIWGKMSDEQKTPFVRKARQNKRIGHPSTSSEGCSTHEEQDEHSEQEDLAPPNRSRTTTRRKCNNAAEKNTAHRLIECLLCHCDAGNYARDLLHQFTWKVNDHFPGLPDETFFLYYKILIGTFVIVAFLTVILSFWQWLI